MRRRFLYVQDYLLYDNVFAAGMSAMSIIASCAGMCLSIAGKEISHAAIVAGLVMPGFIISAMKYLRIAAKHIDDTNILVSLLLRWQSGNIHYKTQTIHYKTQTIHYNSIPRDTLIVFASKPFLNYANDTIRYDSSPNCVFAFDRMRGWNRTAVKSGTWCNCESGFIPDSIRYMFDNRVNCVYIQRGIGHRYKISIWYNRITRYCPHLFRSVWFNSYHRNHAMVYARNISRRKWSLRHRITL